MARPPSPTGRPDGEVSLSGVLREPMKGLVVADAAKADLRAIAAYTEETWGAKQKRRYLDELQQRFRRLRLRPTLGRRRDDLDEGYIRALARPPASSPG